MKATDIEFLVTGLGILAVVTREDGRVDVAEMSVEEFERLRAEVEE